MSYLISLKLIFLKLSRYSRVSLKNLVNSSFQVKSSISSNSFFSHNDANTMIWKLQEFGGQFNPTKRNTADNFFLNRVIKYYRNRISIIFIGFFLLTNQRCITDNWKPYIFVSMVFSAVWAVFITSFAIVFAGNFHRIVQNTQNPRYLLPAKITEKPLYSGHLVIADTFLRNHKCPL